LTSAQREALAALGAQIRRLPPTAAALSLLSGKTTVFACAADERASFTVYAPANHSFSNESQALPVVVGIHGMRRDARLIDEMGPWAEEKGVVVVAPLFPAGIEDVGGLFLSFPFFPNPQPDISEQMPITTSPFSTSLFDTTSSSFLSSISFLTPIVSGRTSSIYTAFPAADSSAIASSMPTRIGYSACASALPDRSHSRTKRSSGHSA
jgi:hypothetical protein